MRSKPGNQRTGNKALRASRLTRTLRSAGFFAVNFRRTDTMALYLFFENRSGIMIDHLQRIRLAPLYAIAAKDALESVDLPGEPISIDNNGTGGATLLAKGA